MKKYIIPLFILIFSFLPAISIGQSIAGNDIVKEKARTIPEFSSLGIEGGITVFLIPGDSAALLVKADENLDTVITTQVVDGFLKIYPTETIRYYKTMEVYVTLVDITIIAVTDYSIVKSDSILSLNTLTLVCNEGSKVELKINANSLTGTFNKQSDAHISGTIREVTLAANEQSKLKTQIHSEKITCSISKNSEAVLKGACTSLSIMANDGSDILALDMKAENCQIIVDSGSDAEVSARQTLIIEARGGSDVVYTGNPPKKDIQKCEDCEIIAR